MATVSEGHVCGRPDFISASHVPRKLIRQKGLASRIDQMWYLEPKWLRCLKAMDPEDLILSQPTAKCKEIFGQIELTLGHLLDHPKAVRTMLARAAAHGVRP